jgi:CubicO group peptidase (beta-lactamase class C family)
MELGAYGEITSVVVSRSGRIVVEEYAEGDAETLRNTRSCTKTVCGMLLGIGISRGLVPSVETALGELLDGVPPEKESITLRDLLTMSSRLDCNDWDAASPGNEELMYEQDDWVRFALELPVRRDREFSYCTAGVVLLGVALERVVGGALPTFAAAELFAPLDIAMRSGPRLRAAKRRPQAASCSRADRCSHWAGCTSAEVTASSRPSGSQSRRGRIAGSTRSPSTAISGGSRPSATHGAST